MSADTNGGRDFHEGSHREFREGDILEVLSTTTLSGIIFPGLQEMGFFGSRSGRPDIPPLSGNLELGASGDDGILTALQLLSGYPEYSRLPSSLATNSMLGKLMSEGHVAAHPFIPGTSRVSNLTIGRFEEAGKTWYLLRAPSTTMAEEAIAGILDRERAIEKITTKVTFSHLAGRFMLNMDAIAVIINQAVGDTTKKMSGQELADYILSRDSVGQPIDTQDNPALVAQTIDGLQVRVKLGQFGPRINYNEPGPQKEELWRREGNALFGDLAVTPEGIFVPPAITIEVRDGRIIDYDGKIRPVIGPERRLQMMAIANEINRAFRNKQA